MANLQYIGARYVPKFYLNPDDGSNDWKSGVLYEALTIVTYNNDSYTSKITVPDTIGNPVDNPQYWACTTKYTAALITLQTTVQNLEDDVSKASKFYNSYSELVADTSIGVDDIVATLGYYAPNDGGAGLFKIYDTLPDQDTILLYYTLANGLYAVCITNEIVLPRYGGSSVHQMVENCKPFLKRYMRNKVVLPAPNGNHPSCKYYIESVTGRKTYYWVTTEPILIDENFAYSDIYLNGEVIADRVIEAVIKISDARKPEDICFMTPVRIGGSHYDGVIVIVDHALLIEGCARVNFASSLQAGYSKNCITLGGTNQNNPIEFFANLVEIGSCTEKGLNFASASYASYYNINSLIIQNLLNTTVVPIYIRGSFLTSRIGQCLITSGPAGVRANNALDIQSIDPAGGMENSITFDTMRISADHIGTIDTAYVKIGTMRATVPPSDDDYVLTLTNKSRLIVGGMYFGNANMSVLPVGTHVITIDNTSTAVIDDIDEEPGLYGRNLFIHGMYIGNVVPETVKCGFALIQSGNALYLVNEGVIKSVIPYTPYTP